MKKTLFVLMITVFLGGSLSTAAPAQAGEQELAQVLLVLRPKGVSPEEVKKAIVSLAAIIEVREQVEAEIALKKAKAIADQVYVDDGDTCVEDPELADYAIAVGGPVSRAE